MGKEITAIYNNKITEHNPPFDVYNGLPTLHHDTPDRARIMMEAFESLKGTTDLKIIEPEEFGLPVIYDTHSEDYVTYIKTISERMAQRPSILVAEIVDPEIKTATVREYPAFTYPSAFPHGINPRSTSRQANQGIYAFDTLTPIMANTYDVSINSAHIALTGADLLVQGKHYTYALCRPPGHHAEKSRMGGYCYLNNAAIAANYLRTRTGARIAILDIDAHHGNGTQDIFYDSPDVFYISLHGDPSQTPPFYSGYKEDKGQGAGYGYNLNIPLPTGTDEAQYLEQLDYALSALREYAPGYLVVSLGFDGYRKDPFNIFNISTEGYGEIAKRVSALELPTLTVQEGGYLASDLGENVHAYLSSLNNQS